MNPFLNKLNELNITLSDHQLNQFEQYYDMLISWNNKLNLTSITDKEEVFIKHFYDSICLINAVDINNQTLLDVGSGAGFPSIPLKIVYPELKVTILDALQKRITFLEDLIKTLNLDVTLIHGRAEEFESRETYDIVTARAVSNLRMLSELCIPFVKVKGLFLAMKGPQFQSEVDESKNAIQLLGGTIETIKVYHIDYFERSIVVVRKLKQTPQKYPRRFNKIKSKPL